ncbi:complement receptor type 2-like [Pezoporus wallicus]|uniref:complement receptor type 2-like n=1 Tax=Pezoporus wallicus TaxID=35540 RepID=UPI002550A3DB|nr:complement receptor type 2-like [Pezoporus wallicus]
MGSGRRRPLLPALLLPLLLPAAWGDCGPLPTISNAEPLEDPQHRESFSVGSMVTYRCRAGYTKLPLLSDTIQCLATSQWSNLPEFCGRSCPSPPRVLFAKVSQQDETQNFYGVGTTVKYGCRPGYRNTTDQLPTSTCLEDLTWSEVPQLCQRKSCGIPANPEHGKVITNDHLLGARADVVCNHGYTLKGESPLVRCSIREGDVAWSQIPACQAISCPPPPAIPNGKHNSSGTEEFTYSSVVMYTCDPGLQLVGNETLHCTTENGVSGVWSRPPPECRVSTTAAANQTKPSEEKTAENGHWLASVLIPSCIAPAVVLGILIGIIKRRKDNKTHSFNMHLQKQETNRRDPGMHPEMKADGKQPVPWHSYFCHTTSCHVCPTCEERLHAALAPHSEPERRGCAVCQHWLSSQPAAPRTYSVTSIGDGESQSPAGTSSPAKAVDEWRGDGTGGAVPEQSNAEQPMDHESGHHVCPVCESWMRAHVGQCDTSPVVPREQPQQQDESPQGPICLPCTDRLHLSLVHSNTWSCSVCPLAREGTLVHLIPPGTPGCHRCPICAAPTHVHLCQALHGRDGHRGTHNGSPQRGHAVPRTGCSSQSRIPAARPLRCAAAGGWLPAMELRWFCAVLLVLPGACGDCPQPPRFVFAEPAAAPQEPYTVGTALRYRCRPGYTMAGGKAPVVTCGSNSSWSVDPDFCIGKSCGPPDIMNGNFEYTTDLLFGATITYTCNTGYRLFGAPSAQCVLKGNEVTWDKFPYCAIIPCSPPPPIINGQLNNGNRDFTFGMAVTYSCNEGYALIGDATIHCTADENKEGQWSGPAPECKVVRCENPEVRNGRRLSGFGTRHVYRDTVTFECSPGHFLNGSSVVTCEADSTWEPPLPTCDPFHCGPAPHFPFAELTSAVAEGFVAGTELKYQCKPGYAAASGKSSVVTCLHDGTWSADVDFCIRQQCAPPTIENGNVSAADFLFETVVTFTCHPGYKLKKSPYAKCVVSGKGVDWDTTPPYCEIIPCSPPPPIKNGQLTNGNRDFTFGMAVTYSCNEGFALIGDATIHCTVDEDLKGQWSGPAPECKGLLPSALCEEPPRIENGMHNGTKGMDFSHGTVVAYKCKEGFTLAGAAFLQCIAGDKSWGDWNKPAPQCRGGASMIIAGIFPLLLAMLIMDI